MSGTPAAGGPQHEPPSTNRGVLRPDDREQGGVDYLKLTVWAPVDDVRDCLEAGILDRYGWSVDPFNPNQEWVENAVRGRATCIHDAGCLSIVEYDDAVTRKDEFCSVEVKGAGCAHLGNAGVLHLLTDLRTRFEIRASRVDVMAHTDCFDPSTAYRAVRDGGVRSRTNLEGKHAFITSPTGDTLYLGMESKPAGGMKRSGDRALRIYNRRGPTRIEIQLTGTDANGAGTALFETGLKEWPMLIRGMMRDYCDFVDADSDHRPTRRTLLP